jgi:hypothetical protein
MAEAPPPGFKSRHSCSRVKTFLMFGEGVISSSDSYAVDVPSHDPSPDPERLTANTFFFLRELCRGEWSLSATLSLFRPQEAKAARRSLAVVAWEVGGTHCSSIMQSGAGACEA